MAARKHRVSGCPATLVDPRAQHLVVGEVSGVIVPFAPCPKQRTWAPASRTTSSDARPTSSVTRKPVWTAKSNRAWSRRPRNVARSGAARRASTSSSVRNETTRRSKRLGGMASTRSMSAACSGCRRAAKRNREWMAASLALRVRRLLPRSAFQVVQERPRSAGRRDPRDAALAGRLLRLAFDEVEQEPEGVPIGGDGVRAGVALGHQPLGEERLEGGGERAHGRAS